MNNRNEQVNSNVNEIQELQNDYTEIDNNTMPGWCNNKRNNSKYKFNEKNDLQILWQDYNWSNSNYHTLELEKYDDVIEYTQDSKPDYGFGRLAVAFKMKF